MKKLALFLCAVFGFAAVNVFLSSEAFADGASKNISFSISGSSQGATLTKDYYVFTDYNGSSFVIKFCGRATKRAGQHPCKSVGSFNGKPSAMYHKWGTDYVQAILKENGGMVCVQLSTMKKVGDSKCGGMLKSSELNKKGDIQGKRQGWTKYGNYYFRGYGDNGGVDNYIWLFDKNKSIIKEWDVPTCGPGTANSGSEVEDVMVDGDTGRVWYTCQSTGNKVVYYIVDEDVFSKWIKSSGSSSDSGGSRSSKAPSKSPSTKTYTFTPAKSQYDGTVETTFFGKLKDPDGCGVYTTLNFVLDLLFVGVGIAAVVGISFAGVKYLTARDNIDQTKRARKWIFQILIGVAIYAVIYGLASWLLADTNFSGDSCKEVTKSLDAGKRNDISAKMP